MKVGDHLLWRLMQQLNPEGGKLQFVCPRPQGWGGGDVDSGEAEGLFAQGTQQTRTASD